LIGSRNDLPGRRPNGKRCLNAKRYRCAKTQRRNRFRLTNPFRNGQTFARVNFNTPAHFQGVSIGPLAHAGPSHSPRHKEPHSNDPVGSSGRAAGPGETPRAGAELKLLDAPGFRLLPRGDGNLSAFTVATAQRPAAPRANPRQPTGRLVYSIVSFLVATRTRGQPRRRRARWERIPQPAQAVMRRDVARRRKPFGTANE
jgi:hypothetical protein